MIIKHNFFNTDYGNVNNPQYSTLTSCLHSCISHVTILSKLLHQNVSVGSFYVFLTLH